MGEYAQRTILLLEDDQVLRRYLAKLLRADEFVVFEAGTVEEAVQWARENPLNLVIADLKLPDDNAIGFMKKLAQLNVSVPVIIITAYGEWETYLEALDLGVLDYLNKPIEYLELKEKIEALLGRIRHENNQE